MVSPEREIDAEDQVKIMAEMIAASVDELHYHHIGIYEPGLSPKAEAVSAIYR